MRTLTILALALLSAAASAQAPSTIAYQGALSESGAPVADGTYPVSITLYDAASGGTSLYAEDHSVTTHSGSFALSVGDGTPTSGAFGNVTFVDPVWVQVSVAGTALTPRTLLEAVPVAHTLVPGARVEGDVGGAAQGVVSVENTGSTGSRSAIFAQSQSTSGYGVFGRAPALSGSATGVYGQSLSTDGRGVFGVAASDTGVSSGVYGQSTSDEGRGVFGQATSSVGQTYGVHGQSASVEGRGVFGESTAASGTAVGVYGRSASDDGRGVYGQATAFSGDTYGVFGVSLSDTGRGVYGIATSPSGFTHGVSGTSTSFAGRGVYGYASAANGVSSGGYFETEAIGGNGVVGVSLATTGDANGAYARSFSTSGRGLYSEATATSGTTYGVYGRVNSPTGYAGYFTGGRGLRVDERDTPAATSTGYVHVRVAGSGNRPQLLLDETADAGFARLRMQNANPAGAYWDLAAGGTGGDAFNVFYWDGTSGGNVVGVNAPGVGSSLITTASGASLTQGGVWANASSRALKTELLPVDGAAVLEALAEVPVTTWRYHAEAEGVRHMGPMSQDFYAAFGLGSTDEAIGTVDADGVALAAIQALHARTEAQAAEIAALRAGRDAAGAQMQAQADQIEALRARAEAQDLRLARLEAMLAPPTRCDDAP